MGHGGGARGLLFGDVTLLPGDLLLLFAALPEPQAETQPQRQRGECGCHPWPSCAAAFQHAAKFGRRALAGLVFRAFRVALQQAAQALGQVLRAADASCRIHVGGLGDVLAQ